MSSFDKESVLSVRHWNASLFSFKTTKSPSFSFQNGQFVMIGMEVQEKPVLRAYSLVSANYEDYLEFLSIKIPNGSLTSKLQNISVGDKILVGKKTVGSLTTEYLLPGKRLYLLGTGTGIAPFISIIKDKKIYNLFEKIILVHGVRYEEDLVYRDFIVHELPNDPLYGNLIKKKLIYYPTVTRGNFIHQGRITTLIESNRMFDDLCLPNLDQEDDRVMLCGGVNFLRDTVNLLRNRGFHDSQISNTNSNRYLVERAFVSKL